MNSHDQHNRKIWEELYDEGSALLRYPDEVLVSYVFRNLKRDSQIKRILDVGFGAGRHVIFMAEQGYDVSGTEVAPSAIDYVKNLTEQKQLNVNLRLQQGDLLPFDDGSFDCVINWGVINNVASEEALKEAMQETYRVLRPKGKFLISLSSFEDAKFSDGAELVEGSLHKTQYEGKGDYYCRFWSRQDAESLVESYGFKNQNTGYVSRSVNFDLKAQVAYHVIAAEKV